jgi:predicted site-specific integrase-resolvase
VSTVTIRRWIKAGRIPAMKMPNGYLRIPEAILKPRHGSIAN